jgi:cytochrome oxidase Cu insertion factor (SCO1/SenC/PrrC family)
MRQDRRNAFALLAAGVAGAVMASPAVAVNARASETEAPSAPDRSPQTRAASLRRYFPNVPLRTHDGRDVRFYDDLVKGKKVLINFTYTNCTATCPRTTENLRRVQEMLGDRIGRDIFIVSLSLDPDRDTPAALSMYAKHSGARDGWTFATGTREDIDNIRRRLGLYDTPDFTQHMGVLTFGNESTGKWAATFALDKPENIVFNLLRRVDPFRFSAWPEQPSSAQSRGSERHDG